LLRRTEEVAQRDQLIQQKERLYVELKAILARQPGPEVAEQLKAYQENLAEKQKQLKSMAAELHSNRQQVTTMKAEQESLLRGLSQLKRGYFAKQQRASDARAETAGGEEGDELSVLERGERGR
ncbi:hypothetical protein EMIHUDRAFT_125626, partial [Emiliania huxleyi CCMP1516]